MRDPVVSSSGQTYDRESITRWFGAGKPMVISTEGGVERLRRSLR
jgi:hypothetical protein